MSFTLEQLRLASPEQLWVELTSENLKNTLPSTEDFSHDAAVYRAFLNLLCINYLLPLFSDIANVEQFPKIESKDYEKSLLEFINGTRIEFLGHRLIIIPSETIDLDEFSIEQEWVDIPELAGDYYLAVQINLEGGWLRVWGFTTHRKLKTEGRYDPRDRTYSLDGEDLFENLNSLWVSLKLCQGEKALIEPLPTLSHNQIERLFAEVGKPSLYSPRLKLPFAQWGAFLAEDNLRQKLYCRRTGKESALHKLGNLSENIFHQLWLSLDELVTACNVNLSLVRSEARSRDNKNRTPEISRGRVIDLGIQLVNHPVALILHFTNASENKRNILLQVHPGGGKTYLPPEVELIVLDDTGEVFLEAKSRQADNWIQLEFRGEPGERFSVKVALGDASIVETFVI